MFFLSAMMLSTTVTSEEKSEDIFHPLVYVPEFDAFNIKEQMTLTPIFTPDNALGVHVGWVNEADESIDIQAQYIKKIDDDKAWNDGAHPLVDALTAAQSRGVDIRVQVREDSDSDDVAGYLTSIGASVRYMGSSTSATDGSWLSATHNKLMLVDSEVILVSSINFGVAFTNSREAGMVIQNANAAAHFLEIFNADWNDGEVVEASTVIVPNSSQLSPAQVSEYPSHTNLEATNFTGEYNITLYTNPDNADEVIFNYLKSAKESIYVSMYTISRQDFVDTLVDLKKSVPGIDIQVLISERRVGGSENVDTAAAAAELVENLIPVYNASVDNFINKAGFYHNKYWIIDDKHTFVYSGNWSPRSTTPQLEEGDDSYSSGEPNRDMGIVVADATDIATYFTDVWDADVAIADAFELPVGVKLGVSDGDILEDTISLTAETSGLTNPTYALEVDGTTIDVESTGTTLSYELDTTAINNGIVDIKVSVTADEGSFSDTATVTVANYEGNFKVLITEVLPDPNTLSDTEGEFVEISNSFDFNFLISDWSVDIGGDTITFPEGYEISAGQQVIIARSTSPFETQWGVAVDIEESFSLTNGGDVVTLYNNKGEVVDGMAFGDETALDGSDTLGDATAGQSFQRAASGVDTNSASDWVSASPTPKSGTDDTPDEDPFGTDLGEVPLTFTWFILGIAILPLLRRK